MIQTLMQIRQVDNSLDFVIFPVSICKWASIGPPAKRHLEWRFADGPIIARNYMQTGLLDQCSYGHFIAAIKAFLCFLISFES